MFDKMTEQVREAAERETELLRVSNLLAESIQTLGDTKRQMSSIRDSSDAQQQELETLKVAYEEIIQLKATTDYEKTAAISERDAYMREKKAADEQVGRGLKALAALENKMATETKLFETRLDELMRKEWKAPAEVKKMQATIDTHEKTIRSLKNTIELKEKQATIPAMRDEMDNLRNQLALHLANKNDTVEEKEEIQQMRNELAELRKDYAAIEAGADEALNEFSNEMDEVNQQVFDLKAMVETLEAEIKELHTLKPRGLSRVMEAAAHSAPAPGTAAPAITQPAAQAKAAVAPKEQAAPANLPPTAGSSSASIPSDYVYQAKCPEDPSQSEYRELAITEVAAQLMVSKQEMVDNIADQKERLKLNGKKMTDEQKINASRLYDEEMGHNVELWHACMGDHG
jgi:archaellum component FlaC